jgi:hypothetical protein
VTGYLVPRSRGLSIEEKLESWRIAAVSGLEPRPIDHRILVAAFRLKVFGRCPRCDQPVLSLAAFPWAYTRRLACRACDWSAVVCEAELVNARHPDDVLVELCRREMERLAPPAPKPECFLTRLWRAFLRGPRAWRVGSD